MKRFSKLQLRPFLPFNNNFFFVVVVSFLALFSVQWAKEQGSVAG